MNLAIPIGVPHCQQIVVLTRDNDVLAPCVLNNGKHVKIVTAVRHATNAKGRPVIEIDTAESAGDSTHTAKGPVAGTKQTKSLTIFGLGGSFHRI